ncbi:MAG TPA: preprotein translocase subunit SecG [Aliiroseovarius sp.]|nr:preprotein translocase subunit SecG [Aliiroseovarius sp.]
METVVLTILLIFAVALVGIVLLQRSEGGGLGMGGGGGGGVMSARGAATALAKITWFLGAGFFVSAMALTVISAKNAASSSVITDVTVEEAPAPALPDNLTLPADSGVVPAPAVEDLMPPPADSPETPPPAE